MPPEAIFVLFLGIFFFIILFLRFVWLASKTGEKAFWYTSIGPLMFIFSIVSILLGNFIGSLIMMFLMIPYVIVILLKYWKRIILAQKELALKGFSPQEPMTVSDYFSLFFSLKGWLKIAEKKGKNQTLVIYFLFNILMLSIIHIGGSYAVPSIFTLPDSLSHIVMFLVISMYFFRAYLANNQPNKKERFLE